MLDTPRSLLNTWIKRLNAGDLQGILDLYCEKALLQPTFCPGILLAPTGIRQYFETMSGYENLRVNVQEESLIEQTLSPVIHSLSGLYRWQFLVNGENKEFEARFTIVMDLSLEAPIVHHHSSRVPESLG